MNEAEVGEGLRPVNRSSAMTSKNRRLQATIEILNAVVLACVFA